MDSANMHLAALAGIPTVSIWGATHPNMGFTAWERPPLCAGRCGGTALPSVLRFWPNALSSGDLACLGRIDAAQVAGRTIFNGGCMMPESFNSTLWKLREAVYLRLYPFRGGIIGGLRILSFLVSLTALIAMIYYHGFEVDAVSSGWIALIVRASLGFFVFKYVLRLLIDLHPLDHLLNNWLEGLLMGLIALNGL